MKLHIAVYCIIKNVTFPNINDINKFYKLKKCYTLKEINEYILNNYNIWIILKNNKFKLLNKNNGKHILLSKTNKDYNLVYNKNNLIRFLKKNIINKLNTYNGGSPKKSDKKQKISNSDDDIINTDTDQKEPEMYNRRKSTLRNITDSEKKILDTTELSRQSSTASESSRRVTRQSSVAQKPIDRLSRESSTAIQDSAEKLSRQSSTASESSGKVTRQLSTAIQNIPKKLSRESSTFIKKPLGRVSRMLIRQKSRLANIGNTGVEQSFVKAVSAKLEADLQTSHDDTVYSSSFGLFKLNLILNDLKNPKKYINRNPFYYLNNLLEKSKINLEEINLSKNSTARKSSITARSIGEPLPKKIQNSRATRAKSATRGTKGITGTRMTRGINPKELNEYRAKPSRVSRKYKGYGGAQLSSFGKNFLSIMHEYDKKHDFGKHRTGSSLSKDSVTLLFENGIKTITNNTRASFSSSESETKILLSQLLSLYKTNSEKYETDILIYAIEKLIKGEFYGDNISSLFAFYVVKKNIFVDSSNKEFDQELNPKIYETLSKFIINFLNLPENRYYLIDTIIQVRDPKKTATGGMPKKAEKLEEIEEVDEDVDLDKLGEDAGEGDEVGDGDVGEGDGDVGEGDGDAGEGDEDAGEGDGDDGEGHEDAGEDGKRISEDDANSISWSNFVKNVLDKDFKKCVPLESKFDPISTGKIKIPEGGIIGLDDMKRISHITYNETNPDLSIEYDTAFRSKTKEYFNLTYYEKIPPSADDDNIWILLKFLKPCNDIYGTPINSKNYIIITDPTGIYTGIAWNINGFGVPLIMKYINLLTEIKIKYSGSEKEKYHKYLTGNTSFDQLEIIFRVVISYLFDQENIKIDDIVNILYDFKKSGDWGQVLYCKNSNIIKNTTNTLFVSGDKLCGLYSLLQESVKTLFGIDQTFLVNDVSPADKSHIIGLYKANSYLTVNDLLFIIISIFNLPSNFLDTIHVPHLTSNKDKNFDELLSNPDKDIIKNIFNELKNILDTEIKTLYLKNVREKLITNIIRDGNSVSVINQSIENFFKKINDKIDVLKQKVISSPRLEVNNDIREFKNFLYDFDNIINIIKICFYKYENLSTDPSDPSDPSEPAENRTYLENILKQLTNNIEKVKIVTMDDFIAKVEEYKSNLIFEKENELLHLDKIKQGHEKGIKNKAKIINNPRTLESNKIKAKKRINELKILIKKVEVNKIKLTKIINDLKEKKDGKGKRSVVPTASDIPRMAREKRAKRSENPEYDFLTQKIDKISSKLKYAQVKSLLTNLTKNNDSQKLNLLLNSYITKFNSSSSKSDQIPESIKNVIYISIVNEMLYELCNKINTKKIILNNFINNINIISLQKDNANLFGLIKSYYQINAPESIPNVKLYGTYVANIDTILGQIEKSNDDILFDVKYYYENIFRILY